MPDLSGKVAFVTAGATGIGFGCAQAIVAGGGNVMICARREDTLREAVDEARPATPRGSPATSPTTSPSTTRWPRPCAASAGSTWP